MRVLIADDDPALIVELAERLRREGHRVLVQSTLADVADLILREGIDLIVFEPALPPVNLALHLCHTLRQGSACLVFVVSRFNRVGEHVQMLEAGADEYAVKPIDLDELLARIHALLRRHPLSLFGQALGVVQVTEDYWLNLGGQQLIGQEQTVPLSTHEFHLLTYLLRHEGTVLSREAILLAVWGTGYEGSTREVDVYIRYLRQKIEPDPARPRYIFTAWGSGYQFKRPRPPTRAAPQRPSLGGGQIA